MFLQGAKISLNGEIKYTDENGKATFSLFGGEYPWIASKEGYIDKAGSINLIGDTDVPILMVKKMVTVKNTTSGDITVVEVIKKTTLASGQEVEIDPATLIVELE